MFDESNKIPEGPTKKTKKRQGRMYDEDFKYSHKNPYHEKLVEFQNFVLRDDESESYQGKWNENIFKREGSLCLEIGSGYGHFMLEYTKKNPDANFIGMDFRFKRSFNLAKKLSKHPNKNFRYLRARGERAEYIFATSEVDKIFYFFPDPWPKAKHHKKRLFQEPFLKAAFKILRPGGKLYIKTDHMDYAQWMDERISSQDLFDIELKTFNLRDEYPDHFLAGFQTKFEKIFIAQNIPIKAFVLTSRKADA